MIEVISPTDYPEIDGPLLFLGGPIQGGPNWQKEAIRIIGSRVPGLTIANPRRDYIGEDFNWNEQTKWERYHLKRACDYGAVMFWLAREIEPLSGREYAQTTRVELTEIVVERKYHAHINLVVGEESGFPGIRYLKLMLLENCQDIKIRSSLKATCSQAIKEILGR